MKLEVSQVMQMILLYTSEVMHMQDKTKESCNSPNSDLFCFWII